MWFLGDAMPAAGVRDPRHLLIFRRAENQFARSKPRVLKMISVCLTVFLAKTPCEQGGNSAIAFGESLELVLFHDK